MLKRIAITALFVVGAALGTAGPVAARTGAAVKKAQKTVVAPVVPQGLCPMGKC
jgi:hypothetical protein